MFRYRFSNYMGGVKRMVDLDKDVRRVFLASNLPDEFTGTVKNVEEKKTQFGTSLFVTVLVLSPEEVLTEEGKRYVKGEETVISYRIPKALTGRGQADILLERLKQLGFTNTDNLLNKTYIWQRIGLRTSGKSIPAQFKENPRHYPVREIKQETLTAKSKKKE